MKWPTVLYAKNIRTRTGKMAQLPKCLLSEQENLSSDHHQKLGGETSTAILALGRQNRRVPGLAGQLVLPNWWAPGSGNNPVTKNKVENKRGQCLASTSRLCMHSCIHIHTHIQVCDHTHTHTYTASKLKERKQGPKGVHRFKKKKKKRLW